MEKGGLIIDGVAPGWVPMDEFKKKGAARLLYTGLRTIGKTNILLGQTKDQHPVGPDKGSQCVLLQKMQ